MSEKVKTGLDQLKDDDFQKIKGSRVGLLANQASVDCRLQHAADLLHQSSCCTLSKLFAPEHGFRGELQDMDPVRSSIDPYTSLPVVSLYGNNEQSLKPKPEDFANLDLLVIDLHDIGSRYYTYTQSLAFCMQTAAEVGLPVMVLDRPNPINGATSEGAQLLSSCRSFCGYAPVANRHGLTIGEFALLMNKGFGQGKDAVPAIGCDLEVIQLSGWKREMYFEQTGLPWIYPSPNMPTLDTALVYPGACLFEATTVSEGRGTTRPFELIGAPYIDGVQWIKEIVQLEVDLSGAHLRPVYFMPKFQSDANQVCGGVQIHISDKRSFQPFRWGLALLHTLAKLYPDDFSWRPHAYEFVDSVPAIDLLYGSDRLRNHIEHPGKLSQLFQELEQFEASYEKMRAQFLIYS